MVFNPLMEEDGHGVLYCNGNNIFKVFLMVTMGILSFSSSIFIDGMWAVARAPAV